MYRAVIVDDEQNGINALRALIEKHTPFVKIVASSTDPEEGVEIIESYRPELLFLDVSMPGMDGFELLDRLQYRGFKLIFTTAHEEYALKAIKNGAFDYLLKPIDIDELKRCLEGVVDRVSQAQRETSNIIELSVRDGIIFIKPNDIVRLEASGSYTTFYLDNGVRHMASKNLKECESQLKPDYFYRCHSSHIVNLNKVVKLVSTDGLFAQMTDGSMPEVAKKNKEQFLERLKRV